MKRGSGTKFGDKCKDCEDPILPANCVYIHHYLNARCKSCYIARRKVVPSGSWEAQYRYTLKKRTGLSLEEFKKKSEGQDNLCAICDKECGTYRRLAVDHDHNTGRIRDLLCLKCNAVLGLVDEDTQLLQKIIDYIERHRAQEKENAV